jgi:hypothetical protein
MSASSVAGAVAGAGSEAGAGAGAAGAAAGADGVCAKRGEAGEKAAAESNRIRRNVQPPGKAAPVEQLSKKTEVFRELTAKGD